MKKTFKNVTVISMYLDISHVHYEQIDKYIKKTAGQILKKFKRKYKKVEGLIIPIHRETRIEITKY